MVADTTVVDPALRAAIEQQAGIALKDTDPAALRFVVLRSKEAGNKAYKDRDYRGERVQLCHKQPLASTQAQDEGLVRAGGTKLAGQLTWALKHTH